MLRSPDVRLVVPKDGASKKARADVSRQRRTAAGGGERSSSEEPTLSAREVFDQILREFDTEPPRLFVDPIEHFAANLESSLPFGDDGPASGGDPYAFRSLIQRVRRVATPRPERPHKEQDLDERLERVRNALRKSRYGEVVANAAELVPDRIEELDPEQRRELLTAAGLAGTALLERGVPDQLKPSLAAVLSVDEALERMTGELPADTAVVFSARAGSHGYDAQVRGKPHGAMAAALIEALRDPAADRDRDGRISIGEAVIRAGALILDRGLPQCPVLVGRREGLALFAARGRPKRAGLPPLRALLIGVSAYKSAAALPGPRNDVAAYRKALRSPTRALFRAAGIATLADREATVPRIEAALARLRTESTPKGLVLVLFSGHATTSNAPGDPSRPSWRPEILCTHEFDGKGLGGLPVRSVLESLEKVPAAGKLVVFDAG